MICSFTIITPNHLDQALVWCQSMVDALTLESDKKVYKFSIFIFGSCTEINILLPENCKIHYVENVLESHWLEHITKNYIPAEACWALKPFLANFLLESQHHQVFYFDSDIYFYGFLSELPKVMETSSILLTPHYLYEYPNDEMQPNDLTLLRAGLFNAGFLGVTNSQEAKKFLKWWQYKTLNFCRNEPEKGMCGDQKWLDLVPILFKDVNITHHKGLNVAYWNLHERNFYLKEGKFLCDGIPLVFFHFSGFDTTQQKISKLSKHSNRPITKDIIILASDYAQKINNAKSIINNVSNKYRYAKWWHKKPALYRKLTDYLRIT